MRPRIKGSATPQTGGITNRANTTAASRLKPGISKSAFRIYAICPKTQNKPNPGTAGVSPAFRSPKYAKRTQFHPWQPDPRPKTRNEPNPAPILYGVPLQRRIGARKRTQSTPPPPSHRTKNAKRTQFPYTRCPATPYFSETNPISTRPTTQHPRLCETNPIYARPIIRNEPNFTPAYDQIMRNEPNLPLRQPGPRSKYAKRTQFSLGEYAKRTQFTPPRVSCRPGVPPKMRNEPNFPPRPEISRTGTACRAPNMRNEPNSRTAAVSPAPPHPDSAKRTQFQHPHPYCQLSHDPKTHNEPNLQPSIYNIQPPGPILTTQNSLSPCCIGTSINSGEVCYASDFVGFWIWYFRSQTISFKYEWGNCGFLKSSLPRPDRANLVWSLEEGRLVVVGRFFFWRRRVVILGAWEFQDFCVLGGFGSGFFFGGDVWY